MRDHYDDFKKNLIRTSALIGAALLLHRPASAASITVSNTVNATQTLGVGDLLTVTNTGIISLADPGVVVGAVGVVSITNNGIISGTNVGIRVVTSAAMGGRLQNTGVVSGGLTGIRLDAASSGMGGIFNTGTIAGSVHGIENAGAISRTAIFVSSGSIAGGIANTGRIVGTSFAALELRNSTLTGGLQNNGTVASNLDAIIVGAGSTLAGGIDNGGTITSSATAIAIAPGGTITGGVTDTGLIAGITHGIANGGVISGTAGGIQVLGGAITGDISNSGTVTGARWGVYLETAGTASGGIHNQAGGIIRGASTGIYIDNGSQAGGGITNSGTISGVNLDGILINDTPFTGGIANSGVIRGKNDGIFVQTFSDVAGGITNNAGHTIIGTNGAGLVVTGSSIMTGAVVNDGTLAGGQTGILVGVNSAITGGIADGGVISGASHGINNAGTVSGGFSGIRLFGSGSVTGGIANAGTVTGGSIGISLLNNASVTGGIDNSGRIAGGTNGIFIDTPAQIIGGIHNTGLITGAGPGIANGGLISGGVTATFGIRLSSGAIGGGVANSGLVTGSGAGFDLNASTLAGGIDNQGGGTIAGGAFGIRLDPSTITGGIHNASGATISGGAGTGIALDTGSLIQGGIDNQGLITGGAHGINNIKGTITGTVAVHIRSGGTLAGGIASSGTITGSTDALRVSAGSTLAGGVSNLAGGLVSGANTGIHVAVSATFSGGVNNSGVIHGGNNGIAVTSATLSGGVTNNAGGTISGGTHGISLGSRGGVAGGISNSGLINGANTGLFAFGSNPFVSGGIANAATGTITGGAIGVRLSGGIFDGVSNAAGGTISGGATGLRISSLADVTGTISNSGRIHGGSTGIFVLVGSAIALSGAIVNAAGGVISGNIGIDVSNTDIAAGIDNSGTVSGNTGIRIVSNSAASGGITTTGTITGTGGKAILLQGLAAGTPINVNGGAINGDVTDNAPAAGFSTLTFGGNFTTNGNFNVSTARVTGGNTLSISPGNTVTMNTMPPSGGTFNFGVTSPASHGSVIVTAGGLSLSAGQITVNVIGAGLANGQTIKIADGAAPDVIAPTTVADNSPLWNFQVEDGGQGPAPLSDSSDLWLTVALNAAAVTPGSGDAHVLAALQALTPAQLAGNGGQLQLILNNVNGAATPGALDAALDAAQPDVSGGAFYGTQNFVDAIEDITDSYLAVSGLKGAAALMEAQERGKSSGNEAAGIHGWGQVFGQTAHQGARDGIEGFDATTAGFAMGIDGDNEDTDDRFGLGVAYGHTSVGANDPSSADTSINSYQVSLYGKVDIDDDTFVRGYAAYARNTDDTTRHNVGGVPGLTAHGDYDADEVTLQGKIGRALHAGEDFTLVPNALARWTWYSPDDYTETGAGAADLNVNQQQMNMFELGLGSDARWDIRMDDGGFFVPALHAGYRYDLIGDRFETTSTFTGGGPSFTSPGPDPARSRVDAGASLAWYTTQAWQFKAAYDFTWKDGYAAHSGTARATAHY